MSNQFLQMAIPGIIYFISCSFIFLSAPQVGSGQFITHKSNIINKYKNRTSRDIRLKCNMLLMTAQHLSEHTECWTAPEVAHRDTATGAGDNTAP